MRILFQGDSITDASRNRDDMHDLGLGYPKYAAKNIEEKFPGVDFEFIDLGISGNQTKDLVERLESDFIDIQPDIVSILIGVNDTWHHLAEGDFIPHDVFEERYRTVLDAIKKRTNAKILIIEQFVFPMKATEAFRADMLPKIEVTRKLAREYADVFVPLDGLVESELIGRDPYEYTDDGVHPNDAGSEYIGGVYADYITPLIEEKLK